MPPLYRRNILHSSSATRLCADATSDFEAFRDIPRARVDSREHPPHSQARSLRTDFSDEGHRDPTGGPRALLERRCWTSATSGSSSAVTLNPFRRLSLMSCHRRAARFYAHFFRIRNWDKSPVDLGVPWYGVSCRPMLDQHVCSPVCYQYAHLFIPPHFISCFSLCVMCKWIKTLSNHPFYFVIGVQSRDQPPLWPHRLPRFGQPFNLPGPFFEFGQYL